MRNQFFFQVRHHWRAVREQNYGRDQKKKMSYYDLPDDREIRSELLEPESMSRGYRGFNPLPPIHHSPPSSPTHQRVHVYIDVKVSASPRVSLEHNC